MYLSESKAHVHLMLRLVIVYFPTKALGFRRFVVIREMYMNRSVAFENNIGEAKVLKFP